MTSYSPKKQVLQYPGALGNFSGRAGATADAILGTSLVTPRLFRAAEPVGTSSRVLVSDPEVVTLRGRIARQDDIIARLNQSIVALQSELVQLSARLDNQAPRSVALTSLGSDKYKLRQTLWAEIDESTGTVTAHVAELEEYGAGATEYEALDDLRSALLEAYEFLTQNETRLGPGPAKQLVRFKDLLGPA